MPLTNRNHKRFRDRLKELLLSTWRLQWHIVTIFLLMISSASLIIMLYTYHKNYQGILSLSSTITEELSRGTIETINSVTGQARVLVEATKGTILKSEDISEKNELLISYLLNALLVEPLIYHIHIATKDGNYISVSNLALSQQTHSYLDPLKELPEGAKFVVHIVDHEAVTPHEIWEYKNTDFATIGTEFNKSALYDPRIEEWYSTVAMWPHLRWSTAFPYGTDGLGISLSVPISNAERDVFAVVSADLSLNQLSNVVALEKVGTSGQAFILNQKGRILVPTSYDVDASEKRIPPWLVESVYEQFIRARESGFMFNANFLLKQDHEKYLVSISDIALNFETRWLVTLIVPFNDFFGDIIKTQVQTILICLAILLLFGVLGYYASKRISSPIVQMAQEVDAIQHFNFEERPPIKTHIIELITLNTSLTTMRAALRSFEHYVPKEIIKTLIQQGKEIALGGERREITILFSDIENFTTIAESLTVEQLTTALTEYFEAFAKIIVESEGTIDKYIGDSVMALWNAPNYVADAADKACIACLRCIALSKLPNQSNVFLKGHTRFGINSGDVIVGNIGTAERMNYTVIGTAVNTAARLETLNKTYHTSALISESIRERLGTRFATRPIDYVVAKGRTQGITLFELIGTTEGEEALKASPEQIELCSSFTKAYELLQAGNTQEAKAQFKALSERFPSDTPTKIYLERLTT